MSSIVRINTLYPQLGDKLWITVDRAVVVVGKALHPLSLFIGVFNLHRAAHRLNALTHNFNFLNKGFEQGFYYLSTVFTAGYYYYLYIYKSHFQADRPQIKVMQNNIYMSVRATA